MKALVILNNYKKFDGFIRDIVSDSFLNKAIEELESLQKEKDLLEEYVQFARLHIETYRCSCGSLGRVGYRCSNKECNKY